MPQFDIEFDDDNATKLIWYLMGKDEERVKCKSTAPGWLPEIKFAAEDTPIKVTSASNGNASKQRILACGDGSNANLDQRRIARYEAAAEINETTQINRDCSVDGCPGIGYYCDATKCYTPRDQLTYGPPQPKNRFTTQASSCKQRCESRFSNVGHYERHGISYLPNGHLQDFR